jgi:aspartate aminotransferase
MELLSAAMADNIGKGSMIRRMFEAGIALKREYGEEAVCDFSLGNPDLPPPPAVAYGLRALLGRMDQPFALGYMPNGGYDWARNALAAHLSREQGVPLTGGDVILTCGAAGGLNALFKAILNPGDLVLGVAPYFVEYGAYVGNQGGVFRVVPSRPDTFALDLDALDAAITPQTRALILNSPNNPTGQVYGRRELVDLCALLESKTARTGRPL